MEKVDSRYTLVIATAKRARQLTGTESKFADKPVITAVKEIYDGDVLITNSVPTVEKHALMKAQLEHMVQSMEAEDSEEV